MQIRQRLLRGVSFAHGQDLVGGNVSQTLDRAAGPADLDFVDSVAVTQPEKGPQRTLAQVAGASAYHVQLRQLPRDNPHLGADRAAVEP